MLYRKEKDSASYEPYPKRVKYSSDNGNVTLSAGELGDELSEENGSEQDQDLSNVILSDNHKE